MSFSADPAATIPLDFEAFDGSKHRLRVKFITSRERSRLAALLREIDPVDINDEALVPLLRQAFAIGVVSPTFDEIEEKMTRRDLVTLVYAYPRQVTLSEIDRGKSRSRLLSPADDSAATA